MSVPTDKQLSEIDFRIGWVCILEKEYYAALEVLDETCSVEGHSTDAYKLGRIGDHNVVMNIPGSGEGGSLDARDITAQMKSDFTSIRFILLVGIGGGAPALPKYDIRLGDVVFGDYVIPYMEDRRIEGEDALEMNHVRLEPPKQLAMAVTKLRERLRNEPLDHILDEIASRSDSNRENYSRPTEDFLWKSILLHQDNVCECLRSVWIYTPWLVPREPRPPTNYIRTHRGAVGSADEVLKNAQDRDRLSSLQTIICFEVGAAAVMRSTECIAIRGIADYADGHKGDDWHNYAALSAAVCAKKLLISLDPKTVCGTQHELSQKEINARLASNERNVQVAIQKVQEANALLEHQAKVFRDFADAQEGRDQKTKKLLESFQGKLQQHVENQQKQDARSDYVTREEWDLLKEQVERQKADIKAREASATVGEFTDILADHVGNDDVKKVSECTGFAGRVLDKFHLRVQRSSKAPSIAGSDHTSL